MKKTFSIIVLSLVLMSTLASASLFNDGWQRVAGHQRLWNGQNDHQDYNSIPRENANTCGYEFNSIGKPIMLVWQYRHGMRICDFPAGNERDKSKSGDLNDAENGNTNENQDNGGQDESDGTDDNSDDNEGGEGDGEETDEEEEEETDEDDEEVVCHSEETDECEWVAERVCAWKKTGNHWTLQCRNEPHHHEVCETIEVCE